MSFQINTAVFNANNTVSMGGIDWQALVTQWQIQTCGGVPVGDPLQALQVVAINKQQMAICNPEAIIGDYNTPARYVLETGDLLSIPANSVHSLAFKVVSGTATVAVAGGDPQDLEAGEFDSFTASTLLAAGFDFECTSGKLVVNTQGPAEE